MSDEWFEAAKGGHEGVVKQLLAVDGIDVNARDEKGDTALMIATYYGNEGCAKLLRAAVGEEAGRQEP